MPRKRDGFIPLGDVAEAVALPGDRSMTLRTSAPQARRHFTRLDQVTQLVGASEADPELGFMARLLALCSLPRTNPGNRHQYKRVNGPYKLVMLAGADSNLPYGIVKLTLRPAQCRDAHSPAPLPSTSLSARNHQPCRLALPQILHELPGC